MATAYDKRWHVGNKTFSFDGGSVHEIPKREEADEEVVCASEAARRLHISHKTLYIWLNNHDGHWECREHGKRLVKFSEIEALVRRHHRRYEQKQFTPRISRLATNIQATPEPVEPSAPTLKELLTNAEWWAAVANGSEVVRAICRYIASLVP